MEKGLDKSKQTFTQKAKQKEPVQRPQKRKEQGKRKEEFQKDKITIKTRFEIQEDIEPVIGLIPLAEEMLSLLKSLKDQKGMMVGVFGQWGRGKTFLVDQMIERIQKGGTSERPFHIVKFHAWKYQDTPAIWAYLFEEINKVYLHVNSFSPLFDWIRIPIIKYWKIIQFNIEKKGSFLVLGSLLIVIAGILATIFNLDKLMNPFGDESSLKNGLSNTGIFGGLLGILYAAKQFIFQYKDEAKKLFKTYTQTQSFSHLLGFQSEIQKELITLLNVWLPTDGSKRLLLFIDDIDRCSENKIIEIVDSLRVLLEDPELYRKIVILAAIDEKILARAVKWKYKEIIEEEEEALAQRLSEYLDKLFISGIKLNQLSVSEKQEIYRAIRKGKVEQSVDNKKNGKENKDNDHHESKELEDELSPTEDQLFEELVPFLRNATPRRIRILYYRFLLSRNLLLGHDGKITERDIKVLLPLILSYSNKTIKLMKKN